MGFDCLQASATYQKPSVTSAYITVICHLYIFMCAYIYICTDDIIRTFVYYVHNQKTDWTPFFHFNSYTSIRRKDLTVH